MGYVVLWILVLATAFLFLATFTSLTARSEKKIIRQFLPRLVFILVALFFVAATVLTGLFYYSFKIRPLWPFYFCLTLALAFIIGSYWAMQKGLPKSRPGPPAVSWPRAALAGSFVIVLCLCLVTFHQLAQDSRMDMATIRTDAVGLALQVWPARLPKELNGAEFYDQASLALTGTGFFYHTGTKAKSTREKPGWLAEGNYHLTPGFDPSSPDIKKAIDDNQVALRLIDKGASCPGFYFEPNTESLPSTNLPFFSSLRDLAWLKKIEAMSKAQNGNLEGALADLAVIERMTDQLMGVPMIISVMLADTINRAGYDGLEYILAHYEGPPAGALPLYTTGRTPAKPCLRQAMDFEKAIWMDSLYQLERHPESADMDLGFGVVAELWKVFYLPDELATLQWIYEMQAKAAGQPYPEATKTYNEIEQRLETEPQGLIARLYTISTFFYNVRVEMLEARRRLAALALAAFNYQQDNGRYPDSLEDLVPKYINTIPIDPFDLKPLKMKPLDDGLDLYSTGIGPEAKPWSIKGPIHFYLGAKAYQEYRVKPFQEEQAKKRSSRRKRK